MTNQQIGISDSEKKTFRITLPGEDPYTYSGTPDSVWAHVESKMAGRGGVPHVEEVTPKPARTGDGETDVQRRARVNKDRAQLTALGFSLGTLFYDRGTAGAGDAGKVRRSATEHEAKPRVSEAVEAFASQIASEHRRDVILPTTELAMRSDGSIVGDAGSQWEVEEAALKQLASRVGIAYPAALVEFWPELRARVWNQHLATAIGHEASTCPENHPARERLAAIRERGTLCRLRDDLSGRRALFAALGERYTPYDVDRVARDLAVGMEAFPDARCEVQYNGSRAQFDVLFHSDVRPEHYSAGEIFKIGIRVRADDCGTGSINVGLLAYQSTCLNMMMIKKSVFELCRLRHLGPETRLSERFEAAMRGAQGKIDHFLRQWGAACEESLVEAVGSDYRPAHLRVLDEMADDRVSEVDLLTGVFRGIGKTGSVSLRRDDLPGLIAAHARDASGAVQEAPITRASVINAITRHAHEHVGKVDPIRQQALENEAGDLLVGSRGGAPAPLPFLPPKPRETVHAR